MLEKMGWSKGKGLGANEDGNQDFVRVKYKHDSIGLGYEDRDDGWTQHETHFEDLLKSLSNSAQNSDAEEENSFTPAVGFGFQKDESSKEEVKHKLSGESLEEKSKNSKARVHYKKFTRGKDLSQYSEKDLANIFGKKSLNCKAKNNDFQKVEEPEEKNEKDCDVSRNFGITTVSSGTSINDYFKNRMAHLKGTKKLAENSVNEIDTEANSKNISFNLDDQENSVKYLQDNEKVAKKLKKKKKRENEIIAVEENETLKYQQSTNDEVPKKKKKKKQVECDESHVDNLQNEIKIEVKIPIYTEESCHEADVVSSRQNKKRTNGELILQEEQQSVQECDIKSTKGKKCKKKNNIVNGIAENNDCVENLKQDHDNRGSINILDIPESNIIECNTKKSKRKKHIGNNIPVLEEINIQVEQVRNNSEHESDLKPLKSKKRRKENNSVDKFEESTGNNQVSEKTVNPLEIIEPNFEKNSTKKSKRRNSSEVKKEENVKNHLEEGNDQRIKQEENIIVAQTSDKPKKIKKSRKENDGTDVLQKNKTNESKIQAPSNRTEKVHPVNTPVSENCVNSDKFVYKINAFCAEKFRHTDINGFKGSNLGEIIGYGLPENLSLQVDFTAKDEERIANMWFFAIDKYKQMQEEAQPVKRGKVNLKRFKKKKVFKFV